MKTPLSVIKSFHTKFVFGRRVRVLSKMLSLLIPSNSSVLDIGCGNGNIGHLLMQNNPSISIQGLEVLARSDCLIECKTFDGIHIPMGDSSVDVSMLVDVLHHTLHPEELLREACRVSRKYILIKDHLCESGIGFAVLKFMDWIGNRPHGVNLVYNYQSKRKWLEYFSSCRLQTIAWNNKIPLYPYPFNKIFGRNLHFIALLGKNVNAAHKKR
jgi:SAM-dependent methyltransferase